MSSYESTVYHALKSAYDLHESLGAEGQQATEQNQFGDIAMVADAGAERAMITSLTEDGVTGMVHSEEHGVTRLSNGTSHRLIVMDGLDGSSVYKRARGKELYGTMLAVFETEDPKYDDYLAAGIALHSIHLAIMASRGSGVSFTDLRTNQPVQMSSEPIESLADGRIFVDDGLPDESSALYPYFKTNHDVFGEPLRAAGLTPEHTGSSAAYYALLAIGKAALVGESTRKGNLEFASAYPVVREAGGTMTDVVTGRSLGSKSFHTYGQQHHRPVMAAANPSIEKEARAIIEPPFYISHQR